MTQEEYFEHIKRNIKDDYSAMIEIAALYKKVYGVFPGTGMSGTQAEYADDLLEKMP